LEKLWRDFGETLERLWRDFGENREHIGTYSTGERHRNDTAEGAARPRCSTGDVAGGRRRGTATGEVAGGRRRGTGQVDVESSNESGLVGPRRMRLCWAISHQPSARRAEGERAFPARALRQRSGDAGFRLRLKTPTPSAGLRRSPVSHGPPRTDGAKCAKGGCVFEVYTNDVIRPSSSIIVGSGAAQSRQ
jgi:hypothetical protein